MVAYETSERKTLTGFDSCFILFSIVFVLVAASVVCGFFLVKGLINEPEIAQEEIIPDQEPDSQPESAMVLPKSIDFQPIVDQTQTTF